MEDNSPKTDAVQVAQAGQYLTFELRNRPYCIPIGTVIEINQMSEIAPVPEAPEHVKGVLNLRGKIIPIVDLAQKFSVNDLKQTEERCIIVIESGHGLVGMIVDAVKEVITLAHEDIQPPPRLGTASNNGYVSGIANRDDQVIVMLDIFRVFASETFADFAELEESDAQAA
jgi:purine-binding chemotaxis protein CheW